MIIFSRQWSESAHPPSPQPRVTITSCTGKPLSISHAMTLQPQSSVIPFFRNLAITAFPTSTSSHVMTLQHHNRGSSRSDAQRQQLDAFQRAMGE